MANGGNLEQAIQQAERIGRGRALYSEARQSINQWQATIQRRIDQPILDQAIALANAQNYEAAISTARQIEGNRALSGEARLQISRWQAEINAQNNLRRAQELASSRTVDSLGQAVQLIRQVPRSSDVGGQRLQLVNNWSYQILSLAQEQAQSGNYQQAIRALQQIPAESAAYNSAQSFLQEWRSFNQPSPVPLTPVAPPAPRVESPLSTESELPPLESPQN